MLSNILDRVSFWALFLSIVLLPLFFLPFSKIPVETSKTLLLVLGLSISVIFWSAARFSDGKILIPRSFILLAGLGIPVIFLISALTSGVVKMSLFGTMLDIGSFWSIFCAYLLMLFSAIIFRDKKNARLLLLGVLASLSLVFLFQILHIFMPNSSAFGVLVGKTANLAGSWNTLGLLSVLGTIISLFLIEFYSLSKGVKIAIGFFLVLSVFITLLVNLPLAWELLGVFALFVFIYKISFYSTQNNSTRKFPSFSFSIVLVSLLFFISGQFIGSYLPNKLGTLNIEVSPTLSSTFHVAKSVFAEDPLLGIGPNGFEQAWYQYKSALINSSKYWDTSFYTGSGLIPTFFVTTGALGTLVIVFFFYVVISTGIRKLFVNMKSAENVETTIFFISVMFLMLASFFYAAGITIYLLLFAFCGVFAGLSSSSKDNGVLEFSFLTDPRRSFFSILGLVLLMMFGAGLSFKFIEKFVSVEYFGQALLAQTPEDSFRSISKAVDLHQNDLYYRTYAQVELLLINQVVEKSKNESLSEEEKANLQASYDRAVKSATLATEYNPKNSQNWELLGTVYHSVSRLGLTNAYDKALESYQTALKFNPLNPSLKLSMASVFFLEDKKKEAKELVAESLALKANYTEGLLMMSQIEKSNGNNAGAISYAEQALQTLPSSQDISDYLESLKTTQAPIQSEDIETENPKTNN